VLAPRSLAEMHTPQALDADWTEARCLGWFGRRRGETVALGHGGSMHGFISSIQFHRASRTGVVVLTNEGRHEAAATAALDTLDLLLAAVKEHPASSPDAPPAATPPELRRLLGRYQLRFGGVTHVEYRDGALKLAPTPPDRTALHAPARLEATAEPLRFRVTQGRAAGEVLEFVLAPDGAVRGFTLSGFTYTRLG
jgi:hypothetical protein